MLTRDLLAFVTSSLPAPPAQILEIGAGTGELALALDAAGYATTAIDPAAEPGSHVERRALLEVTGRFDAAVAIVALHHVNPLEESCAHLSTLLGPGATLVIDEIDIDRYDERATGWWLGQRRALGLADHGKGPAQLIEELRQRIHSLGGLHAALRPYFDIGEPIRGPYLHRWGLRASLHEAEIDLIADGLLPAVGCRQIAIRRPDVAGKTD